MKLGALHFHLWTDGNRGHKLIFIDENLGRLEHPNERNENGQVLDPAPFELLPESGHILDYEGRVANSCVHAEAVRITAAPANEVGLKASAVLSFFNKLIFMQQQNKRERERERERE